MESFIQILCKYKGGKTVNLILVSRLQLYIKNDIKRNKHFHKYLVSSLMEVSFNMQTRM